MKIIYFILIFTFSFLQAQDEDLLLVRTNPERGSFLMPSDMNNSEIGDPEDSFYWNSSLEKQGKKPLKIVSRVFESSCIDCLETLEGMYQFQVKNDEGSFRITLSREQQVNLFRFSLMSYLGYNIPSQTFAPYMKINFKDSEEKEVFKYLIKEKLAGAEGFSMESWIHEEGEDWLEIKSALIEKDWDDPKQGFHWLNIQKEEISKYRALRGLFVVFLLTDWGEELNINVSQFLRKKRGNLFIKHPLAYLFGSVHINDLKWMMGKILELHNDVWNKLIANLSLNRDEEIQVRSKLMAYLNFLKDYIFSKEEAEKFPIKPTDYIIDRSVTIPALKKNFRYYVMMGMNALVDDLGLKELEKLGRVDLDKKLKEIGGNEKDFIGNFLGLKDKAEFVIPLVLSARARAGIITRYSRDLVRGQYYGNTHLANLADTMRYGVKAFFGIHADLLGRVPFAIFLNSSWEERITYLQPVQSLDEAYKKFWRDPLLPTKMYRWKKHFKEVGCKYKKGRIKHEESCQNALSSLNSFLDDLKLDETVILNRDINLEAGAGVSPPSWKPFLWLKPFDDSYFGGSRGKLWVKRTSIIRTESGIRVILTKNKNFFNRMALKLKTFISLFSYNYQKTKSTPDTLVYDLDIETLTPEKKLDAFLALKTLILNHDASYLQNFFDEENIENTIRAKERYVQPIPLVPFKKDKVDMSNKVELSIFDNNEKRELLLFKTVKRSYWDWLGLLEDVVNGILPFGEINFRSTHTGENAGDVRRNAKIKVVISEVDLTDRQKQSFNPMVFLNHKDINWRIGSNRIQKKIEELEKEYKDIFNKKLFEGVDFSNFEEIKQFELQEIVVLKDKLINRWLTELGSANMATTENSEGIFPKALLNRVNEIKKKMVLKDIEAKMRDVHELVNLMLQKMNVSDIVRFFKDEEIYYDIQLTGWGFIEKQEKPVYISQGVNDKQEEFFSVFGHVIKELGLPEYEVRGNFIAPGF